MAVYLLLSFFCRSIGQADDGPPPLRLNQTQVRGTHNSYHIAPDAVADSLIRAASPKEADANAYRHRTLTEQLEEMGIRQFELDLFLDPKGGLFAHPLAWETARKQGKTVPPHDPDRKLEKPGIKVLHSPGFDFRTTVYTLADGLAELLAWSEKHPRHFPIFLLLELKSESFSPLITPPPWDSSAGDELEREILAVLPRERILAPDDVRGSFATLPEAIAARGWPTIDAARGKFVLLLDNEGAVRDAYLQKSPGLAGRLLFASVDRGHPAAAWMKVNDAIESFDEIRGLVKAGFLVRTRADVGGVEARANDPARRDKALASGAQLVSTDFPEPDPRYSTYCLQFAGGVVARPNPVSAPAAAAERDLE